MKKTFIFYNDRIDYTESMTHEEKGMFLDCILQYQNGGKFVLHDPIKFIRPRVKKQLDEDNKKREDILKVRREAASKGGKAKASKSKQMLANAKQMLPVNVNVNVNDNVNKKYICDKKIDNFVEVRNKQEKYNLPKVRKITDKISNQWLSVCKEYQWDEILKGLENYCKDIHYRVEGVTADSKRYFHHRFGILEFLKQENGLQKFINK